MQGTLPIVVNDSGSVMDVSERQLRKVALPIVVSESGSVMDGESTHEGLHPNLVSESGSVMDVSEEHPKASSQSSSRVGQRDGRERGAFG